MAKAVCFCPNGVQADDPTRLDSFSKAGLRLAVSLWQQEHGVFVINYDIPVTANGRLMGETTVKEVREVVGNNFQITAMRSFNALTVVTSHALHCKERGIKSVIVVSGPEIADYFRAVAKGVQKTFAPNWQWEVVFPTDGPRANAASTRLYKALALVTRMAALNSWIFRAYAWMRNALDRRRLKKPFVGTLKETNS